MTDYLLIAQDRAHVDAYRRSAGEWIMLEFDGLGGKIEIESVGAFITMSELYGGVEFGEPEPLREASE